jgi:hypothetical protein
VTVPPPPRTQDAVIFNEPGRRTIPRGDGGDSCAGGSAERTPAHEAALHITALVSGTDSQGQRPDAQPASIAALAVPSCPPRTQRTFPGVSSSNLATFAPSAFVSSNDFLTVAPAAFQRAAFDARHGFFVEQPCDCASSGLATAKRRGKCRRAKQVSNTFTSSPFVAHPERMATANRGRGWFVVVLLAGRCAGISAVKISPKLRIKIVRSSDGFRPVLVQLSDNSRPQNQLTALDVRRAVWNGACYVRPLHRQGE